MSTEAKFRIHGVEVLSFTMEKKPSNFEGLAFSFDINAEFRVAETLNAVVSVININVREEKKQETLATLATAVGFEVENFESSIVKEESGLYKIPTDLEIVLRTISISTSRGILFMSLKGSYLHKAILPIVAPLITPIVETNPNNI